MNVATKVLNHFRAKGPGPSGLTLGVACHDEMCREVFGENSNPNGANGKVQSLE